MKNYERIKEYINKLAKEEFIEFIDFYTTWSCEDMQEKMGMSKINCEKCKYYDTVGCVKELLKEEFNSNGGAYERDD